MPGSASYSNNTATSGPELATRSKAVVTPYVDRVGGQPAVVEDTGEEVVGEVLLVVQFRVCVDLVADVNESVGERSISAAAAALSWLVSVVLMRDLRDG